MSKHFTMKDLEEVYRSMYEYYKDYYPYYLPIDYPEELNYTFTDNKITISTDGTHGFYKPINIKKAKNGL